jgi:hypothetical protein
VLEDAIRPLLARIKPFWSQLLTQVAGLNPFEVDLTELANREIHTDRTQPGFEDFSPQGSRFITPGDPARSLLYHALASPLVHPAADSAAEHYADLAELDALESYIWGLRPVNDEGSRKNAAVMVFAYEYRPAGQTAHGKHADFVFSRTGVARTGEAPASYDRATRSFQTVLDDGRFAVAPTRFGAFLAVPVRGIGPGIAVMDGAQDGDAQRTFWLPVTKLWNGASHIFDSETKLQFREYHRSEKFRRLFLSGKVPTPAGADLNAPPYSRDSKNSPKMIALTPAGQSVLVSPEPKPLAFPATLPDGKIATYRVPPLSKLPLVGPTNRHGSSLMVITNLFLALLEFLAGFLRLRPKLRPRNAPEFVSIRHMLRPDGSIEDLNLRADSFNQTLEQGNYEAVLFEDSTSEGFVVAEVTGLSLDSRPAYSLVSPPAFFPLARERDLQQWFKHGANEPAEAQFNEGGPAPLCDGRLPPNPTLELKPGHAAFSGQDETAVAIVCQPARAGATDRRLRSRTDRRGYLTDECSNEFAPGWDVSYAHLAGATRHYATVGLGSPFLEDVTYCAAANAYWPAAAPDAARTYNKRPTAVPLLDFEIGYHARHPKSDGKPTFGWDGEQGPFLETVDGVRYVNSADIDRADYISNAQQGLISATVFREVRSQELIDRMEALRRAIARIDPQSSVSETKLWLVYADAVADLSTLAPLDGTAPLKGRGYRFEFVQPTGKKLPDTAELNRARWPYEARYECHVGKDEVRSTKRE